MKRRAAIILALALAIASKASALSQPCCPWITLDKQFDNTPLDTFTGEFYKSGKRNALDYRVLASIAKLVGNGGDTVCGMVNDPFHNNLMQCNPHGNFGSAIAFESDYVGVNYIANNQTDFYIICTHYDVSAPGMPSLCEYEANIFRDLLGDPHSPVRYSTGCCGDCNVPRNQNVSVSEITLAVRIDQCQGSDDPECAGLQLNACPAADTDYSGVVFITDLIRIVNSATFGCQAE